tara:strand:- start:282 stop:422 length:141 start_codon:yes stop_codon:yes gene_type:complete
MQDDEDKLNWTHFPQDRDDFTIAEMTEDEARQAAKKAMEALRRKKT